MHLCVTGEIPSTEIHLYRVASKKVESRARFGQVYIFASRKIRENVLDFDVYHLLYIIIELFVESARVSLFHVFIFRLFLYVHIHICATEEVHQIWNTFTYFSYQETRIISHLICKYFNPLNIFEFACNCKIYSAKKKMDFTNVKLIRNRCEMDGG